MGIKIITDSVADVPKKIAKELNITVMPLTVNFEDASYRDGIEITSKEFFDKLAKTDKLPSTSQVPTGEFLKEFENAINAGDEVIAILMSSRLSGTYNSAVTAMNFIKSNKITVFDSKAVTLSQCLMVIKAARMAKNGENREKIISRLKYMRENMVCKFIIDNLEYLKMGGRISEAQAMIGKFLNIKPILTMDDGRLRLENKVRGRKKAIKWIVNWIKENRLELEDKIVSIYHSNDYEYFKQLRDTITDNFSVKELIEGEVGAVVGTHAGPGCVAVAFIK